MFSHYSSRSTLIILVRPWTHNFSELGHSRRKVMRTGAEEQEKLNKMKDENKRDKRKTPGST